MLITIVAAGGMLVALSGIRRRNQSPVTGPVTPPDSMLELTAAQRVP
jgi:hypothetical protein